MNIVEVVFEGHSEDIENLKWFIRAINEALSHSDNSLTFIMEEPKPTRHPNRRKQRGTITFSNTATDT